MQRSQLKTLKTQAKDAAGGTLRQIASERLKEYRTDHPTIDTTTTYNYTDGETGLANEMVHVIACLHTRINCTLQDINTQQRLKPS